MNHTIESITELEQIIANSDLDVLIVRRDIEGIEMTLTYEGYEGFTTAQVVRAVNRLAADPYYTRIAKDIK